MKKNQTQKINDYRANHRRCKFCKYWRIYRSPLSLSLRGEYTECFLKNKAIITVAQIQK